MDTKPQPLIETVQLIKDIPNTPFKKGWWLVVDEQTDLQVFYSDARFKEKYTPVTVSPDEFAESPANRGTVELEKNLAARRMLDKLSEAPIG